MRHFYLPDGSINRDSGESKTLESMPVFMDLGKTKVKR
jgi:hypothetical protein